MDYTLLTEWREKAKIISTDAEKVSDKIRHLYLIETLNKVGTEENDLNITKTMY